ncbi:putative protein tyrosine phosphatase [Terriglobus roseus DSM 18391]|uniref:Phosphotyrosine protein phosphatase I domain-containing protein n=1 Tax=Terriglobus roseus (strain DSM 18391 / NRRL B-41598 / KBS 63) TaxID=926566 RepID=I3ZJ10_TERRK|nr:protein-tyrosine-phosphatase [Terriglobus roseus]AFL89228.1 putative protein tyrosine phosphatase [Terriglobus roseus DSM 18391]
MNLLFVCSRNRLRSPTAEAVFSMLDGYEVLSAGTGSDSEQEVSTDLVDWADVIFAMEGVHRRRLNQRFGARLRAKRLIVLGIRDEYSYMDPRLVELLKERVLPHLPVSHPVR